MLKDPDWLFPVVLHDLPIMENYSEKQGPLPYFCSRGKGSTRLAGGITDVRIVGYGYPVVTFPSDRSWLWPCGGRSGSRSRRCCSSGSWRGWGTSRGGGGDLGGAAAEPYGSWARSVLAGTVIGANPEWARYFWNIIRNCPGHFGVTSYFAQGLGEPRFPVQVAGSQ